MDISCYSLRSTRQNSFKCVGDALPRDEPNGHRTKVAINPNQRDSTEDEGRDCSGTIDSLSIAAAGHRSSTFQRCTYIHERMTADVVDCAGSALFAQSFSWGGEWSPVNHFRGPKGFQASEHAMKFRRFAEIRSREVSKPATKEKRGPPKYGETRKALHVHLPEKE
jgi:hypothetical protein